MQTQEQPSTNEVTRHLFYFVVHVTLNGRDPIPQIGLPSQGWLMTLLYLYMLCHILLIGSTITEMGGYLVYLCNMLSPMPTGVELTRDGLATSFIFCTIEPHAQHRNGLAILYTLLQLLYPTMWRS